MRISEIANKGSGQLPQSDGIETIHVIGWLIWAVITLAHSWGFWRTYKWASNKNEATSAAVGGTVAGLTGWFWANLVLTASLSYLGDGTNYAVLFWLYGLLVVPFIGALMTVLFWAAFNSLNSRMGSYGRALVGTVVGTLFTMIVGSALDSLLQPTGSGEYQHGMRNLIGLVIAPISFTSAIMAGDNTPVTP